MAAAAQGRQAPFQARPSQCMLPQVSAREPLLLALQARCGASSAGVTGGHVLIQFKPDPDSFDCGGWLSTFFACRGRALRHIMPPLCFVVAEALLVATLAETHFGGLELPVSEALEEGYRTLMVPVSFLLVFRLNRAAVRYYDARAAMGKLVEVCRTLAGQAAAYCAHDPSSRDDLCRWVVALPVATRNYLRAAEPDPVQELEGVLTPQEAADLGCSAVQPLFCVGRMRRAALAAARSCREDAVSSAVLRSMEESIAILTGAWGAVERINNTPLPFAYVAHLRTFMLLYLVGMPLVLQGRLGWATPAVTFLIAFGVLGIEGASVACERPFGMNHNHLPLDNFCGVVAKNVAEVLGQAEESELPVVPQRGPNRAGVEPHPRHPQGSALDAGTCLLRVCPLAAQWK